MTSGVEEGIMGETRGKVKLRNLYKGPMDKDNSGGGFNMECGGWVGQGRVMGENGDNCN